MSQFESETSLTELDNGRWQGSVSPHWGIGENPNGGYLVSIAMNALRRLSDQHPDPMSVTAHYLRPGVPGEVCEVETELIRAGRLLTTGRATLTQEGKARIVVMSAFGDLGAASTGSTGRAGDDTITVPAPDIPPPDACIERSGAEQGVELPLLDRLDIMLHPGQARAGDAGKAEISGWVRFKDGHPADSLAAVLFTDAFPPSVFGSLGAIGWVPTLELTVHVCRRPAPGWMLGRFQTHSLADGRMIEDGALWDANGDLVAQSRQLGLLMRG